MEYPISTANGGRGHNYMCLLYHMQQTLGLLSGWHDSPLQMLMLLNLLVDVFYSIPYVPVDFVVIVNNDTITDITVLVTVTNHGQITLSCRRPAPG